MRSVLPNTLISALLLPGAMLLAALVEPAPLCAQNSKFAQDGKSLVNLAHLNALYREVQLDTLPAALVFIYSEYPDYRPVEAPGEGIACLDDVARAAVLYMWHYRRFGEGQSLARARRLLNFCRYMQAENGLFYNFLWQDLSINREGSTSRNTLGWWTARALWALGEGVALFQKEDPAYARLLRQHMVRAFPHLDTLLTHYPMQDTVAGLVVPRWLLHGSAADATSEMMLGLAALARVEPSPELMSYLRRFARGILLMQLDQQAGTFYGLIRSWRNIWHGWGNSQSQALLALYRLTGEQSYLRAARLEVDRFYPRWVAMNFPREIRFSRQRGRVIAQVDTFPQIAYALRPAICATAGLLQMAEQVPRRQLLNRLGCWFFGGNSARAFMYEVYSGRAMDGILGPQNINRNAGAESTIEALLSLMAWESVARAPEIVPVCRQPGPPR